MINKTIVDIVPFRKIIVDFGVRGALLDVLAPPGRSSVKIIVRIIILIRSWGYLGSKWIIGRLSRLSGHLSGF